MGSWCILFLLLLSGADGLRLGDVIRWESGDSFKLIGQACDPSACSEHGAGVSTESIAGDCACSCPQRAPLFREDRELCVDDLPECSLATFGSGNIGVQKIPFVYLPLKGQIIHPSREITFYGVKTPICAVSGAQFLTRKGFVDLRNSLDSDVPFSLFRDEGRTFLQWSGEDELRTRMSGRVMVVRLLCRDVSAPPASPLDLRGVFTPCVAFRVQGTSIRQLSNMSEVQFATNAQTSETTSSGLTVTEYVAIGISSLLLGLIYVASVFLYLHTKKRRRLAEENERRFGKGIKRRDGKTITEHDIVRINNERIQTITNSINGNESGVVKKNPLLNITRQFQDIKSNFNNDSESNVSDSEDYRDNHMDGNHSQRVNRQVTSAIVHPTYIDLQLRHDSIREVSGCHRDESGIEKLPDEHVSIVETTDDREITRPVGTTRRKLYFNPAYFEPHLMAEPPPAAIEFLTKIREVITIAKHKMATKRFQPVLNEIPEEETYPSGGNSIEFYQGLGSQRSGSVVSLKRDNGRKRVENCVGCPGCKVENNSDLQNLLKYEMPTCSNCLKNNRGDKQNSIRKWLENIPNIKQNQYNNEGFINKNNSGLVNSLLSLPYIDNRQKIKKQNSFNLTNESNHDIENFKEKRNSSTMSVKSEPTLRNFNFPISEIDETLCHHNNFKHYGQTISRIDDIKPIGLGGYRSGSYRNNAIINQKKNKFITNKNALPDMVNDALALEHGVKSYSSSDEEKLYKRLQDNCKRISPMNTSENPPANDYETDSLERSSHKKGVSSPSEYVDVSSSQASPSLSAALPLEEELTMRNDIYKRSSSTPSPARHKHEHHNHYETIAETSQNNVRKEVEAKSNTSGNDYSLVSEVYVNNNYNFGSTPTSPSGSETSMGSRKNKNVVIQHKPGSLTIEVKDSPENYIKIHESDSFEPDTLDRKHSKCKNIEPKEKIQFSRKHLLEHLNNNDNSNQNVKFRSSGTFTKVNGLNNKNNEAKFCSLRVTNECRSNLFSHPNLSQFGAGSKSLEDNLNQNSDDCEFDWETEEGRILTLELRHSKRQRQITPPKPKQFNHLARPDILPPLPPTEEIPIYEQPAFPPRRVEVQHVDQKNLNSRSLSPMLYTNAIISESTNNSHTKSIIGHQRSPMRASVIPVDCENRAIVEYARTSESSRSSYRRRQIKQSSKGINTNTYVKTCKEDSSKYRLRRRIGSTIEDSGYLSSDSTSSRQAPRKVIPHVVSYSESDDTENEARSESGAESVETHSVFFGSFRKVNSEGNGFEKTKNDNFKRRSSKKQKFTNV